MKVQVHGQLMLLAALTAIVASVEAPPPPPTQQQPRKDEREHSEPMSSPQHPANGVHWSYGNKLDWPSINPKCGNGERQSPIDIITKQVLFEQNLRLDFIDYDKNLVLVAKNTHHSVSVIPKLGLQSDVQPSVRLTAPNLPTSPQLAHYVLKDIHFHWGLPGTQSQGSEHKVDGVKYDAEMHMVHFSSLVKDNEVISGPNGDGALVIGVFIKAVAKPNPNFAQIVKAISKVSGNDEMSTLNEQLALQNILPTNKNKFYHYKGSLTTPPCAEVVDWVILADPIELSQDQIGVLSNFEVQNDGGNGPAKLGDTTRPVNPLHNRQVFASFVPSQTKPKLSSALSGILSMMKGLASRIPLMSLRREQVYG